MKCDNRTTAFHQDITRLLNKYSVENGSDTPDFILCKYIQECLNAWTKCVRLRDKWWGVKTFSAVRRVLVNGKPVKVTSKVEPAKKGQR